MACPNCGKKMDLIFKVCVACLAIAVGKAKREKQKASDL